MSPVVYLTCEGVAPTAPVLDRVVAGKPGHFEPYGAEPPADLAGLDGATAEPDTRWNVGEYVVLGDGSEAWWDGDSWEPGRAVVDPCLGITVSFTNTIPASAPAGNSVLVNGKGFSGPNLDVMVASVPATHRVLSDTRMVVTIPPETSASNAVIYIATDCGSVNGNVTVVAPAPPTVTINLPDPIPVAVGSGMSLTVEYTASAVIPSVSWEFLIDGAAVDAALWTLVVGDLTFTSPGGPLTQVSPTQAKQVTNVGDLLVQTGVYTTISTLAGTAVGAYTLTAKIMQGATVLATDTSTVNVT